MRLGASAGALEESSELKGHWNTCCQFPQRTNKKNRFNSLQLPRKVHRVWKTSARKPVEFCISPLSCRVCVPRHLSLHWSWHGSCTKLLKKQGTLQSSELFLFQAVSHKLVLTYLSSQWVVKGYIVLIKIWSKRTSSHQKGMNGKSTYHLHLVALQSFTIWVPQSQIKSIIQSEFKLNQWYFQRFS